MSESRYRALLYFNLNGIEMGNYDSHYITILDGVNSIEVVWKEATVDVATDGYMSK
jgi:hypothetical protein